MYTKKLYQTIYAKGEILNIEREGPFICKRRDAWLGTGCYYWENFIDYAHWWGRHAHQDSYFICKTELSTPKSNIYDLEDSDVLLELDKIIKELKNTYSQEITIPFVIEYLKKINIFDYKAIRARFEQAIKQNSKDHKGETIGSRIRPITKSHAYLDLKPQIQICLIDKSIIEKGNYKVVYPSIYEGYV